MKLSKKGEYALRAMIALARANGSSMTISQIAVKQKLPKKFLEQILLALKSAGLVTSRAGPKGGYELGPPSQEISVRRILEAVVEPISRGASRKSGASSPQSIGKIEELLAEIRNHIREQLERIALSDLAAETLADEQVEELMWYI